MNQQLIFVFDTNVLLDFPKVVDNEDSEPLTESTIDLTGAHLIIPTAVIRELESFKKERHSERGRTARKLLGCLRALFNIKAPPGKISDSYYLRKQRTISDVRYMLSIMPVHKNFCNSLPFKPADDDMDGQIILTTIAAACIQKGLKIDGTVPLEDVDFSDTNVTLLTNDNGLALRADARAIKIDRYGYKLPRPYTGRRDLEVPAQLLEKFYNGADNEARSISLAEWQAAMPDEEPLVANEFIVMNNDAASIDIKLAPWGNIGRYDAEAQKIVPLQFLSNIPVGIQIKNAGQAMYMEALMDPSIAAVICTGSPGTGKTYLATIYSYLVCKLQRQYIGIAVVPCQTENRNGYLPGDLKDKLDPVVQPIKNAIRNFLLNTKYSVEFQKIKEGDPRTDGSGSLMTKLEDEANLIFDNWFGTPIPIDQARGRDFTGMIAFYDEFQDQNASEADTLITRLGEAGKVIITGDVDQVHAAYLDKENNGLVFAKNELMDDPAVAIIPLVPDEIIRHPLIKRLAERRQKRRLEESAALKQKRLMDGAE